LSEDEIAEGDRLAGAPHPREHGHLFGHAEAEAAVLQAWKAGRLPHALLIGGPEGIGKATLAYRIARFAFAHPEPTIGSSQRDLSVPADNPASRQVATLAHPDFLVLRRVAGPEREKLPSDISVDEIRRTVSFFGQTASFGGWRVCIVDSVDELNRFGTNALLKILEEPPPRSLLLLIAHAPGRVIPTIRSRCQVLRLKPLSVENVAAALNALAAMIPDLDRSRIAEAATGSGGSVRRALALLLGEGLEVRSLSTELLGALPKVDAGKLHQLGDRIQSEEGLGIFAEAVEDWLAAQATRAAEPLPRLARLAETWEKVRRAAVETDVFRLDRKPFVFQVFAMLADATRR
jgi:DNA polymerase-3 subunit delta'